MNIAPIVSDHHSRVDISIFVTIMLIMNVGINGIPRGKPCSSLHRELRESVTIHDLNHVQNKDYTILMGHPSVYMRASLLFVFFYNDSVIATIDKSPADSVLVKTQK